MIATSLGIIGVFVPLMPTTCFIILAAWAFAKSSPIAYQRLLNNPHLGPKIKDWQEHRIISRQSKRIANISITLSFALSLFIVRDSSVAMSILVSLMIGLLLFINSRPSEPTEKADPFSRTR
ncbi:MAG: YbaN family protein [Thiomicrorhabdus sp.]|nr:YbaN family protein [Thiomicrorhabdus sp.]